MEVEKGEIITLTDNREYVCLSIITSEENKKFLFLMTTSEPIEFCFAEETSENNIIKMRIIGGKEEKRKLFNLLKTQSQANFNRGPQHA